MTVSPAVAWGLIPIGLAPFALRLSDPALAVTITNLPPGAPIGRALPVAGIVAAVMVGGSAVAPTVDPTPRAVQALQFVQPAAASESVDDDNGTKTRSVNTNRGPSAKYGPSAKSGKGTSGTDDDDGGNNRSRGGEGDDDDNAGTNRRNKTSGPSPSVTDDVVESGSRRGKGSGSGKTTPSTPDEPSHVVDSPDAPDTPDTPDDPSGVNSGSGKG